jgi:hypothetical protein
MNRAIRRATERRSTKAGTSATELLHSLANLDGVANLSTKLEEFIVASKKMEAIADKLDDAEVIAALGNAKELVPLLKERLQAIEDRQKIHGEVLANLLNYLQGCTPNLTGLSHLDLDAWELKLKEAHDGL